MIITLFHNNNTRDYMYIFISYVLYSIDNDVYFDQSDPAYLWIAIKEGSQRTFHFLLKYDLNV